MTLRKITIDNSLKYISRDNNSISNFKPKTTSLPKKQNEKLSLNKRKFIKDYITGQGFRILKSIMKCYF